jgi:hypothetical protein
MRVLDPRAAFVFAPNSRVLLGDHSALLPDALYRLLAVCMRVPTLVERPCRYRTRGNLVSADPAGVGGGGRASARRRHYDWIKRLHCDARLARTRRQG